MAEWWITTDFFRNGGTRVMGPFGSRDLALTVRAMLEKERSGFTYAVDFDAA